MTESIKKQLSPTYDGGIVRELSHWGNTSKDFFATVGCSFTYGIGVDYKDSWSNVLAKMFGMEHVNIAFPGSSIEYQRDKLDLLIKLLPSVKFCVWMMTFPTRSHADDIKLSDEKRRMQDAIEWRDPQSLQKIVEGYEMFQQQNVLSTNVWFYPPDFTKIMKGRLKNSTKFYVNDHKPVDLGFTSHVGPQTHKIFAEKLYDYIKKFFPTWVSS